MLRFKCIYIFVILYACAFSQDEDEFTFGGAAEEEADIVDPKIKLSQGNDGNLTKSEIQLLYITCDATVNSTSGFKVRWMGPQQSVLSSAKTLVVKSLVKANEGMYTCIMEKETTSFNESFKLTVTIPSISISVLPEEILQISGRIYRKCSDLGFDKNTMQDKLSYEWVNQANNVVSNTDVLDLPILDMSVNGVYECRLKTQLTNNVYKAMTTVSVVSPGSQAVIYGIKIIPTPDRFEYKEPFRIKCEVPNYDGKIEYRWYHKDKMISSEQIISYPSFDRSTVGNYKCEATILLNTGKLTLSAETNQQFTIFQEGTIEMGTKPGPKLFVHEGDNKELHFEIEAESGFIGRDAQWYFNGKKIEGNIPNVGILRKILVSMLVITDITLENEGNYECVVNNSRKEVNIIVLVTPGSIETSPKFLKVTEGQEVEFHCRVANVPNIINKDLRWKFQNKQGTITYNVPDNRWISKSHTLIEQTNFLSLSSARVSDTGYYICKEPGGLTTRSELVVIPDPDAQYITITPKEIRTTSNNPFEIECFSKNKEGQPIGKPSFVFADKRPVEEDPRFVITDVGAAHIKLTARNGLPISENNLKIICKNDFTEENAIVYIKDLCPPGNRYCRNGQCLENGKFCNGIQECADGSDEDKLYCSECDPISKMCQKHNGKDPRKKNYLVHWTCDGEQDCGNGFDEADENCASTYLSNCGGKMFTCDDGKKIPRGYTCDQSQDCANADDEIGCNYPQIIKTSETKLKVSKFNDVTMTCEASGKPLPVIVWRFNWKCLPTNTNRFNVQFSSQNCSTTSSKLTISNFQPGDDGIYNCEALSGQQRAFSDDFQVFLQNN